MKKLKVKLNYGLKDGGPVLIRKEKAKHKCDGGDDSGLVDCFQCEKEMLTHFKKKHTLSKDCWCNPAVEDYREKVITEEQAIQRFADTMIIKMLERRARYKKFGWRDPEYKSVDDLRNHLWDEMLEWEAEQDDLSELVDIANSAFMLWDRLQHDKCKEERK